MLERRFNLIPKQAEKERSLFFSKKTKLIAAGGSLGAVLFTGLFFAQRTTDMEIVFPSLISTTRIEPSSGQEKIASKDFDVVIYGNNISGVGVIEGLQKAYKDFDKLKIVFIGTEFLDQPQGATLDGICLEDFYGADERASGFYKEFRDLIIKEYTKWGIKPLNEQARLVYEPEIAQKVLLTFYDKPNVSYYSAHIVEAKSQESGNSLIIEDNQGNRLRINARYCADASVEGDLARALGASYKIGTGEDIYNDINGPRPPHPSSTNNFNTAPESLSEILTLTISGDPEDGNFSKSWSMTKAVLPNNKRELNEGFTDYSDPDVSFDWFMGSWEKRMELFAKIENKSTSAVARLQSEGYTYISGYKENNPYVRGDLRIVGETTYTETDILNGKKTDVVAYGCYSQDRHASTGTNTNYGSFETFVPMESLVPLEVDHTLVTRAISSDSFAYNCSRVEPVAANLGEAAGAMIATAMERNLGLKDVAYADIASIIEAR